MTSRSLAAAAVVAALCLSAGAEERPRQPHWVPSIEKGLELAEERGVAFMVALNMDRERGNQQMVDEIYTDPAVLAASESCVVAIASLSIHKLVPGDTTGGPVCERFGSVTCDDHRTIEDTVRRAWLKRGPKDDVESPRHFFLAPNGKILFQKVWTLGAEELAALMTRASELCTPERLEAWDTLDGRLERALDPIAAVRDIALEELIAENDPEIDGRLAEAAKKAKDDGVAGSILGAFARADDPARRELAQDALKHSSEVVRMRVAYAMGKSGFADHLKPLLGRVSKEKDEKAQGSMARAIGTLGAPEGGEKDKDAKKALAKLIGKNDHALVAIAPWATDKDVKSALLRVLTQGGSQETRAAAVWALGYSEDTAVREKLVPMKAEVSRREWRLKRALELATEKLRGKDVDGYDTAIDNVLPDPAVDDGKKDEPRWPGGGGGRDGGR